MVPALNFPPMRNTTPHSGKHDQQGGSGAFRAMNEVICEQEALTRLKETAMVTSSQDTDKFLQVSTKYCVDRSWNQVALLFA